MAECLPFLCSMLEIVCMLGSTLCSHVSTSINVNAIFHTECVHRVFAPDKYCVVSTDES